MEIIQGLLYPVHDADNKIYIMPPDGVIVTSETQKLILSDSVSILGVWKAIWDFGIPVIWNWDVGFPPVEIGILINNCEKIGL